MGPDVGDGRGLGVRARAEEEEERAGDQQADDREDLDEREPELELAEELNRGQVHGVEDAEGDERGIHCGTSGNQKWV